MLALSILPPCLKLEAWLMIRKKMAITWNGNPELTLISGLLMTRLQLESKSRYLRPGSAKRIRCNCIQHARHSVACEMERVGNHIIWRKQHMKGRSRVSESKADVPVMSKLRYITIPILYWVNISTSIPTLPAKIIWSTFGFGFLCRS